MVDGYFCSFMSFKKMSLKKISLIFTCLFVFFNVFSTVRAALPKVGKMPIQNHSFSNYKVVKPYKLELDLDVDFHNQQLSGSVLYHLKWNSTETKGNSNNQKARPAKVGGILNAKNTQSMVIFDTKGLIVNRVQGESGDLIWHYGDTNPILGKALEILTPNHDTLITVYYRTLNGSESERVSKDFISALQWLDLQQTHDKKQPFMFSQSQAILARTWLPCMDVPAVKFTYSARVNFPDVLNVVMSAQKFTDLTAFFKAYPNKNGEFRHFFKRKASTSIDNVSYGNERRNMVYFHQSLPITSYLMAIAVGDFQEKRLSENCLVYSEPGLLDKAAWEFADLPKMIDSASALYGQYAWKEYNVLVLPPSFPFGGMENPVVTFATPTIITGDRSLVSLLAHELAHSWSGNLVTNETWDDFWLNEGFTVYFESRIMEKLYGRDYAQMLAVLGLGELKNTLKDLMENAPADTRLKLDLKGRNPDDGLTDIAYEKGRFFLLWCENTLGRKSFDKFLNQYFKVHAFSTSNTESFVKELTVFYETHHKNSKLKPTEFKQNVKEWIYDIGFKSPNVKSQYLLSVESLSEHINSLNAQNIVFAKEKGLNLKKETQSWTTHHYLHFLRNLDSLSFANMRYLDSVFHFSHTQNSEIAFDWSMLSIKSKYVPAYASIGEFLLRVGRRKFVLPIYEALLAKSGNQQKKPLEFTLAFETYEKARPNYHSVTQASIDELFKFDKWTK